MHEHHVPGSICALAWQLSRSGNALVIAHWITNKHHAEAIAGFCRKIVVGDTHLLSARLQFTRIMTANKETAPPPLNATLLEMLELMNVKKLPASMISHISEKIYQEMWFLMYVFCFDGLTQAWSFDFKLISQRIHAGPQLQ